LAIVLAIFGALTGIKYYLSWIAMFFTGLSPLVTVYAYQVYKYCKTTDHRVKVYSKNPFK